MAVIVIFIIIGNASGGGGSNTTTTKKPTTKKTASIKTVKLNEPVQVGEVKWTVLEAVKKDTISDNSGYYSTSASGVFLVIKLTAELTGKTSGTINSTQLNLIDNKNRTFKSSTEGQIALTIVDKENLLLTQVNPNVPVTGYAVYDIAKNASGLKLKINDLRLMSTDYAYIDLGI